MSDLRVIVVVLLLLGMGCGPKQGGVAREGGIAESEAGFAVETGALVQPLIDGEWAVGMTVGLVFDGRVELMGFGRVALGSERAPDVDTVFEIGSVSKVFTGVLTQEVIRLGLLDEQTSVAELMPSGAEVPEGVAAIRVVDLLGQMSGLPRMPSNFEPANPQDPFADYSADKLYEYLSTVDLQRAPGEAYDYSNVGFGLLGHLVGLKAGLSYEQMVAEWVAAPLGMTRTSVLPSAADQTNKASGHGEDLAPVGDWSFDALAGAGALRSTAADMVRFAQANLSPGEGVPGQALGKAQQIIGERPGGLMASGWHVGLALEVEGADRVLWHNGQTGGYHSFLAVDVDEGLGVVVLSNTAGMVFDQLGAALYLMLRGAPYALDLPGVVAVDEAVLQEYVGVYELAPSFRLTVVREDGRLYVQATGQGRFRVYPRGESSFFFRVVEAEVHFVRGEDGQVAGLKLLQNGQEMPAKKLPELE